MSVKAGFTHLQVAAADEVLACSGSEADVRAALVGLLRSLGSEPRLEYATGHGPADVVCVAERVVFETKAPGEATDPTRHAGSGRESPQDQLFRYVDALLADERWSLPLGSQDTAWWGVVTDGRSWHRWYWAPVGKPTGMESLALLPGRGMELLAWLWPCVNRDGGLPAVPEDPYGTLFRPRLLELLDIGSRSESDYGRTAGRTFDTQWSLWYDKLRGSGMAPPTRGESKELFLRHSFLVAAARSVIAALSAGPDQPKPDADLLGHGFASWIVKAPGGAGWTQGLFALSAGFDWRSRPRDVLRGMYETVIDRKHRKVFGEYYTPDWVAEMIAEHVLDDAWCERALAAEVPDGPTVRGVGVLDPACGSGTFLYHAARRLATAADGQGWTEVQTADMVSRLVHGIDIHPVAVEIARASLLRALPVSPSAGQTALRVYQGDALLSSGRDRGGLFRTGRDGYEIDTPGGRAFMVPRDFTRRPRLGQRLRQLVAGACDGHDGPNQALTAGLTQRDTSLVEAAHDVLVEVVREEGNGVWGWYAHNQIAPILLSEDKVDRIVANPPWVRMSEIQVKERKRRFEEMAHQEGLWPGGKNATGFDIAAPVRETLPRPVPGRKCRGGLAGQLVLHPRGELVRIPRLGYRRRGQLRRSEQDTPPAVFGRQERRLVHRQGPTRPQRRAAQRPHRGADRRLDRRASTPPLRAGDRPPAPPVRLHRTWRQTAGPARRDPYPALPGSGRIRDPAAGRTGRGDHPPVPAPALEAGRNAHR